MRLTKAAFRALREECGISQQNIADEFDVKVLSVKRWENDDALNQPPGEVWQWLLSCRGAMHQDARELADQMVDSFSRGSSEIVLDYHRTQESLDDVQLGAGLDEPVGYYNARMRLIGMLLDKAEVPYTFEYPQTS